MTAPKVSDYPELDECMAVMASHRDQVAALYDVRYVFACYLELMGSLIAAIRSNGIYTDEDIATLLLDMSRDAFERKSHARCVRMHGKDVVTGSKQ
jgi:hypothetical protein